MLLTQSRTAPLSQSARALFPDALRPSSLFAASGRAAGAQVHPSARIEAGVTVDPLAVIGPRAEIGAGTLIAAGAVIGPDVCIGRHCAIGAGATIIHALIGDRVIIHPGARIGHDGFGYRAGLPPASAKFRRPGALSFRMTSEIGANATIERGATRDTVIGEGTKIGSLVHIADSVDDRASLPHRGAERHCRGRDDRGFCCHKRAGWRGRKYCESAIGASVCNPGAALVRIDLAGSGCDGLTARRNRSRERAMTGESVEAVEILEILRLLPHRYPFLMIDRIIEIRGDEQRHRHQERDDQRTAVSRSFSRKSGHARRFADRRHGADRGRHRLRQLKLREIRDAMFLLTIDKAKFRKPAVPGDRIEYHVTSCAIAGTCGGTAPRPRSTACSSPRPKSAP